MKMQVNTCSNHREKEEKRVAGALTLSEDAYLNIGKRTVVSMTMDPSSCTWRRLWPY
jgi:uncharacterized protein YabE (DUF348 family)